MEHLELENEQAFVVSNNIVIGEENIAYYAPGIDCTNPTTRSI